jgi:tetratricopeptide (TPR) repeat protein
MAPSHRQRLAALIGADEAQRLLDLQAAWAAARRRGRPRTIGGIELLSPASVDFLGGDFRPGLLGFAREGSGDQIAWDLRRQQSPGPPSAVVYCDHEIGQAVPFARDVDGAFVHLLVRSLLGTPRAEALETIEGWLADFSRVLSDGDLRRLQRLAARARRAGEGPLLASTAALGRAIADLLPPRRRGWDWAMLPPTDVPLLSPDDPGELDRAIARYRDAAGVYRQMVHDEGRTGYAAHLAAALRGLAEVCLRRGRRSAALAAAHEAIDLYRPYREDGDTRIYPALLFVHRVAARVEAGRGRHAVALEHAEEALELSETLQIDGARLITAFEHLGEALERQQAGEPPYEVGLRLKLALKESAPLVGSEPPHLLQAQAARLARLVRLARNPGPGSGRGRRR